MQLPFPVLTVWQSKRLNDWGICDAYSILNEPSGGTAGPRSPFAWSYQFLYRCSITFRSSSKNPCCAIEFLNSFRLVSHSQKLGSNGRRGSLLRAYLVVVWLPPNRCEERDFLDCKTCFTLQPSWRRMVIPCCRSLASAQRRGPSGTL